jgi:nitrate/TMAO reductase-like tetraheme cytochrome c subunit
MSDPVGGLKRRCRRAFLGGAGFALILALISFLALDKALGPLSSDEFCAGCHEMEDAHQRWAQSPHHTNPGGVKVPCVACHLPPRENHAAHVVVRTIAGVRDLCTHFFGDYDREKAREHVLRTLSDERCVRCHSNLLAMPSSGPVEVVHKSALQSGRAGGYGCVICHNALHGPKAPEPEPMQYEEAENSFCYVCHINFIGEEFVTVHKKANIGCVVCHGESRKHSADEDHVTPPDTMYKKADVNDSCMTAKCHPEAEMEREIGHRPFFAKTDTERKYCTDCHGMHMIPQRHRKWDRTTRELIFRDGYRTGAGGGGGGMM